jgi:MobA/MobL family
MAIYSCNLSSVGRSTHAPGTAGAHLRYVSRDGANPIVQAHAIPLDATQARSWMDREENLSRANARLIDKIRVAIPRELSREGRQELVGDFVRDLTGNRVPWIFAIHQEGEDSHNPHAHIVLRDRDIETGKRVLRLSDNARDREKAGLVPKAVEWIRERWEHHVNVALERAGIDERVDRRTLKAQGIDREPTIHLGPQGQHIEQHVQRATSKKRVNGAGREIDYEQIDQGRTRKERHAEIVDLNLERACRSPDHETRLRAKFEREQARLDRSLESELAVQARKRTREERALKKDFRTRVATLKSERRVEYNRMAEVQRETSRGRVRELRSRQRDEHAALRTKHASVWLRFRRAIDWTGRARSKHLAQRREQTARHKDERHGLALDSRAAWTALRDAVAGRFAPREATLVEQRVQALAAMRVMHTRGEAQADAKRQLREIERAREYTKLEDSIRLARQMTRRQPAPAAPASPLTSQEHRRERSAQAFEAAFRRSSDRGVADSAQRRSRDGPSLER